MAFTSILKPDGSIAIGIATGVMVYAVYDRSLPSASVMHATDANDSNIEAGRKKATWTAAGVLAAVTLLTKDVNVFILGGVVLGALDFHARHANASNPVTGALVADQGYGAPSAGGQLRSVS
jgi:hypothetical protein